IATAIKDSGVDVLMGIGGAPEGVIAAAALQCVGGDMQGRLKPRNNDEIERAKKMGVKDINKIFSIDELANKDNAMFAATGVTDGDMLEGVRFFSGGATTHSIVMRSKTRTIRFIEAEHHFDFKADFEF
ncbi:MAG TPA: fructose-bisphosphatase class II, partial [Nitrospinae bacterium]|nr:fructose-bisphosphatase class II [Nitrospinota bacterium]